MGCGELQLGIRRRQYRYWSPCESQLRKPGTYRIKMFASSDSSCADSAIPRCGKCCLIPLPISLCGNRPVSTRMYWWWTAINNTSSTLTCLWDFGNSHTETVRSPAYAYPAPAPITWRLPVSTTQCPGTPADRSDPHRSARPITSRGGSHLQLSAAVAGTPDR